MAIKAVATMSGKSTNEYLNSGTDVKQSNAPKILLRASGNESQTVKIMIRHENTLEELPIPIH